MFRLLASILASALVASVGIIHGNWTDRWGTPIEPAAAAERFAHLPMSLGDWDGHDVVQAATKDRTLAGLLHRVYTNRRGQKVEIFLVCGRPGPVAIHTPEACYTANGFQLGARTRLPAASSQGEFWTADALKQKAAEETKVRIFWSWNGGKGWTPSEDARLSFARTPVLHKLYVVRELDGMDEAITTDPCLEFMHLLLPEMDRVLFNRGSEGQTSAP